MLMSDGHGFKKHDSSGKEMQSQKKSKVDMHSQPIATIKEKCHSFSITF